MTRQETFKRRIRARMARTGERYGAARRALIDQGAAASADSGGGRAWVAPPGHSDDAVRAATGRGWDEWCDVIESWPGHLDGHTAIAAHLTGTLGVDGWWAQSVTVGYERITGLRLPYQRPDGTFVASKSRTVEIDAERLRAMLLDAADRLDLFPGFDTELRSRPASKVVRVAIGPGVVGFSFDPARDGAVKLTVTHEQLPDLADVDLWKAYWSDWLDAVAAEVPA